MGSLFDDSRVPPQGYDLPSGAYHLPRWLSIEQQQWLVEQFRLWASGPVPAVRKRFGKHQMSVYMAHLGWHWNPNAEQKYTKRALDGNQKRVLEVPEWLIRLGQRAVSDTGQEDWTDTYSPDIALANFYPDDAAMGMHQDKDELSRAPVVSLSLGNSCTFRFGNSRNRNAPFTDIRLASGDLFVFGGPSRMAFHGVTKIHPDTAPQELDLPSGRINITLRESGMT